MPLRNWIVSVRSANVSQESLAPVRIVIVRTAKNRAKNQIVAIVGTIVLAATASLSCQHVNSTHASQHVDMARLLHYPAPGQPVVLDFFFNSCEACQNNEADLEQLGEELEEVALLIGVSIDCEPRETREWIIRNHPSYEIINDCKGELVDLFNVEGYPTTIVIDREGNVIEKTLGLLSTTNINFSTWTFDSNADLIKHAITRAWSYSLGAGS